jgi:5-methylcytosine-specific restriction endonuclease McrA
MFDGRDWVCIRGKQGRFRYDPARGIVFTRGRWPDYCDERVVERVDSVLRHRCIEVYRKNRLELAAQRIVALAKQNCSDDRDLKLRRNPRGIMRGRRFLVGRHTQEDRQTKLRQQRGRCSYCGKRIRKGDLHWDHHNPVALGGTNYPSNIQPTCSSCNIKKGAKDPLVFARSLGKLL